MRSTSSTLTQTVCLVAMLVALVGDSTAVLGLFDHQIAWAVAVHVGSSLIWLAARLAGQKGRTRTITSFLSTEAGAEFCVTLILFPGLGMLSAAASLASNFVFAAETRSERDKDKGVSAMSDILASVESVLAEPFDPMADLAVQPLVARLANATSAEKRAAIDLICRCPHPQGMEIVRSLLADADPDMRALAALAVNKLAARTRVFALKNERAHEALDS